MADYTLTAKLMADAKGFIAGFEKAQGKIASFSNRFDKIGGKLSGIGDKLTKSITLPAVGAATALGGIALVKGWSRLTGIDTAQAKLMGLGHDAKNVELIMTSALDAVRGTSYGMDEAATTAASAVAAGIKPGKELTRYLSLTGDAAAIAGANLAEMGPVFNKIQTSNKAYNDSLGQLSDRGLPIYQWLAKEAGVAEEAVFKMASDGEVSSKMFLKAIENNIGGAAKIMGENSFTAALSNIWASVSRIGANFLDAGGEAGGFFSTVKPLLTDFTNSLGKVEGKAAELGSKFGEAFNSFLDKAKELKAKFDELSAPVQNLILKGGAIGAAIAIGIGPAIAIAGTLATGIGAIVSAFGAVLTPVGLVIAAIVGIGVAFAAAMVKSESFREKVFGVFEKIKSLWESFPQIWQSAQEKIGQIFDNFAPVFETFKNSFMNLKDSIFPIWESLKDLWNSLIPIISLVGATVGAILVTGYGIAISVFNGVVSALGPLINAVLNLVDIIVNVVNVIVALLTGDFAGAWDYIKQIGSSTADFFKNLFTGLVNFVMSFVDSIVGFFHGLYMTLVGNSIIPDMVREIIDWFRNMVTLAVNVIKPIVAFFKTTVASIKAAVGTIVSFFADTFTKAYQTSTRIFSGIVSFVGSSISKIRAVINTLSSAVSAVFSKVYSIASSAMNRVKGIFVKVFSAIKSSWSGLTGMVSNIFSGISSNMQRLVNQVKGFVNGVIGGINSAIGLINKIPGVSISPIPQLARGTDDWGGGFARMNEGGRGELVKLPDGTQVIPHDVSMRYAREAGQANAGRAILFEQPFSENGEPPTPAEINVYVGSKKVATEIVDDITKLQKRSANRQRRNPKVMSI